MPTMEDFKMADLAAEVLKVLDKQAEAEYFKTRDRQTLIVSKQMEKALRQKCAAILIQSGVQVKA